MGRYGRGCWDGGGMNGFDWKVSKISVTSRELILHAIQYSPPTFFHPIPDKQSWPYKALIKPLKFSQIRPYIFSLKGWSGISYSFKKNHPHVFPQSTQQKNHRKVSKKFMFILNLFEAINYVVMCWWKIMLFSIYWRLILPDYDVDGICFLIKIWMDFFCESWFQVLVNFFD